MMRFRQLALILASSLALAGYRDLVGKGPGLDTLTFQGKLDTKVRHFETAGRSPIESVLELAYQYEIPVGIEYLDREALTQSVDLRFENESVQGILSAIVRQIPEYKIAFLDGMVDIFAPRERDDPSNLLNRVIKNFNVADKDTGDANFELACALGREIDKSEACVGSIASGQLGEQKITVHLQNAKVYEIVNAIVAQSGQAVWTVIVDRARLHGTDSSDLWHLYPLQPDFKTAVWDKLSSLRP